MDAAHLSVIEIGVELLPPKLRLPLLHKRSDPFLPIGCSARFRDGPAFQLHLRFQCLVPSAVQQALGRSKCACRPLRQMIAPALPLATLDFPAEQLPSRFPTRTLPALTARDWSASAPSRASFPPVAEESKSSRRPAPCQFWNRPSENSPTQRQSPGRRKSPG